MDNAPKHNGYKFIYADGKKIGKYGCPHYRSILYIKAQYRNHN